MKSLAALLETSKLTSELEKSIGVGSAGIKSIHVPEAKKLGKKLKEIIEDIEDHYERVIGDAKAHDKDPWK